MAKLKKEELIEKVTAMAGENPSDEYISLIEDMSDSFVDESDDWKSKYEENDANWRKRYIERFSNKEEIKEEKEDEVDEDYVKTSYEDLFEEKE